MLRQWLGIRTVGLVLGAAATALAAVVSACGVLRALDDMGLDLHFRFAAHVPADPRIVLIDIDDSSIAAVGQWPWPRIRHAELVRTLHELSARTIVLDLILADPTPPRLRGNIFEDAASVSLPMHGDPSAEPLIWDDRLLAAAIAASGNVLLSAYLETFSDSAEADAHPRGSREGVRHRALQFVRGRDAKTFAEFTSQQPALASADAITPELEGLVRDFRWAQGVRCVEERTPPLATALAGPAVSIDSLRPPLALFACAAKGFGLAAFDRDPSRGVVRRLPMLTAIGDRVLPQLGLAAAADVLNIELERVSVAKGHVTVGKAGSQIAFPIEPDGDVLLNWHAPPTRKWQDSFVHLPAALMLKIADRRNAIEENERRFGIALGELVEAHFQQAPQEFASYARLINEQLALQELHRTSGEPAKARDRIERVAEIDRLTKAIEEQAVLWLKHAFAEWSGQEPRNEEERAEYRRLADLHGRFGEGQLRKKFDDLNAKLAAEVETLLDELRPKIAGKLCFVGYTATAVADLVSSPIYSTLPGVMAHANVANMILQGRIPGAATPAINQVMIFLAGLLVTLASNTRGWRVGLAALALIAGCTLLLGLLIFWARSYHLGTLPAALAAIFVWAVVTVYRQSTEERVRRQLQRALTQYMSPAIAARIAERVDHRDLAPRAAVVTCFFSDLSDFTRISERLGPQRTRDILNPYLEATSRILVQHGAIVNKFVGDGVFAFFNAPIRPCPDHARAACLAAIEVEDAIEELNVSLERSVHRPAEETRHCHSEDTLHRHSEHTLCRHSEDTFRRHSDRTLRCHSERSEESPARGGDTNSEMLREVPPAAGGAQHDTASAAARYGLLRVRIGITTGEVFVGDYGSADKLDYTCIGDTVNICSRLEEANKVFGTTVVIDDATRHAALYPSTRGALVSEDLCFRSLGRLLLPGKEQIVTAHELMKGTGRGIGGEERGIGGKGRGMRGEGPEVRGDGPDVSGDRDQVRFIAAFERMIGHYQRGEWEPFRCALSECRRLRSIDAATDLYEEAAIQAAAASHEGGAWIGALVIGQS